MDYIERTDTQRNDLVAQLRVSQVELANIQHGIEAHLTRRLVDALYAELLPVMRERVGKAINAIAIARCIEGEVSLAVHAAFGGK